jgi:hypothetical protein
MNIVENSFFSLLFIPLQLRNSNETPHLSLVCKRCQFSIHFPYLVLVFSFVSVQTKEMIPTQQKKEAGGGKESF